MARARIVIPPTVARNRSSINVSPAMIRVLHLLDADGNASGKSDAEFQSQRLSHHLTTELGPGFEAEILTIGPGGRWPTLPAAIMGLRRIVEYDIIHTWGSRPLTAAVLGSRLRLVHSPQ